ncbi:MAG TPA: hypothetical protein VF534_04395 [Paraburkholderia sp.]
MSATNNIDVNVLKEEFKDYVASTETDIKAKFPALTQIEVLAIIAMGLFQATKEAKAESIALQAEIDRLRGETVGALTDAGIAMLAEGATAPGEIPRAIARLAESQIDGKRYRAIAAALNAAKAGGSIEVNQALQYYEKPKAGDEVEIRWYPDTPVSFYVVSAATLDAAADELIAHMEATGAING